MVMFQKGGWGGRSMVIFWGEGKKESWEFVSGPPAFVVGCQWSYLIRTYWAPTKSRGSLSSVLRRLSSGVNGLI